MAKDDEIAEGTTLLGNITLLLEDEGRGTGDHDEEKTKPGSQVDTMHGPDYAFMHETSWNVFMLFSAIYFHANLTITPSCQVISPSLIFLPLTYHLLLRRMTTPWQSRRQGC